ncbi:MAG: hypothetical protein ACODAD_14965, partial [Planctomycetota bacterium]
CAISGLFINPPHGCTSLGEGDRLQLSRILADIGFKGLFPSKVHRNRPELPIRAKLWVILDLLFDFAGEKAYVGRR